MSIWVAWLARSWKFDQAETLLLMMNDTWLFKARHELSSGYWSAGRINDSIRLDENNLDDRIRILGPDHPDTLKSRHNLAAAYRSAGRFDDAERVLNQTPLA